MMLSFQLKDSGQTIQIACDQQGLETLIGVLEQLRNNATHIHLRTPSNGVRELSEQAPWGEKAIDEVIIITGGD